jgi:hypothetical protein|tara:strand:- start:916 stop:1128 length:213 start_codon:yes stop_codon:yes gene_type:complete
MQLVHHNGLAIEVPRKGLNIEQGESVIKRDRYIQRHILGNSESFRQKMIQKDIATKLKEQYDKKGKQHKT